MSDWRFSIDDCRLPKSEIGRSKRKFRALTDDRKLITEDLR